MNSEREAIFFLFRDLDSSDSRCVSRLTHKIVRGLDCGKLEVGDLVEIIIIRLRKIFSAIEEQTQPAYTLLFVLDQLCIFRHNSAIRRFFQEIFKNHLNNVLDHLAAKLKSLVDFQRGEIPQPWQNIDFFDKNGQKLHQEKAAMTSPISKTDVGSCENTLQDSCSDLPLKELVNRGQLLEQLYDTLSQLPLLYVSKVLQILPTYLADFHTMFGYIKMCVLTKKIQKEVKINATTERGKAHLGLARYLEEQKLWITNPEVMRRVRPDQWGNVVSTEEYGIDPAPLNVIELTPPPRSLLESRYLNTYHYYFFLREFYEMERKQMTHSLHPSFHLPLDTPKEA